NRFNRTNFVAERHGMSNWHFEAAHRGTVGFQNAALRQRFGEPKNFQTFQNSQGTRATFQGNLQGPQQGTPGQFHGNLQGNVQGNTLQGNTLQGNVKGNTLQGNVKGNTL